MSSVRSCGPRSGAWCRKHQRVGFAFDPRCTALLWWGGDKTGDPKWYDKFVPNANDLFDQHLRELEQEQAGESVEIAWHDEFEN